MSGEHDCPEDRICVVDVPAGEHFREVFTAVPRQGYAFAGWRDSELGLRSGKKVPLRRGIAPAVFILEKFCWRILTAMA